MYLDANNLYGWVMSQKLPINSFKWVKNLSKFNESFIKNYDENSDKGYFLEVDVKYPKKLFNLHSDLPFLLERKQIKKCNKLVCTIQNKKKQCYSHECIKTSAKSWINTKKVHRVIQFNQEAWVKPYINMNTELRKEAKKEFEKDYFKLMNNPVFGKTMENVRNHRDIELITTNEKIKKKKKISFRTKLSYNKTHYRKFVDNRNEKDRSKNE